MKNIKVNEVEKIKEEIFSKIYKISNPNKNHKISFDQKTSDWLTKWAGSWTFVLCFLIFIFLWITVNLYSLSSYFYIEAFDPYPFILLNLILSCIVAIQAPIILMSQNRASQRDRIRTEYDYQVNRKAEKEIREVKEQLNRIEEKLVK
jgi:uncharacterized membrane protein